MCWRSLLEGLEPRATALHFQPTLLLHTWMHAVAVSHDPDAEIQRTVERKKAKGSEPSLTRMPYCAKPLLSGAGTSEWQPGLPGFFSRHTGCSIANIYLAESKVYSMERITPECCGGARWLTKIVENVCFFWTHLAQSWQCSHATNVRPVFISLCCSRQSQCCAFCIKFCILIWSYATQNVGEMYNFKLKCFT